MNPMDPITTGKTLSPADPVDAPVTADAADTVDAAAAMDAQAAADTQPTPALSLPAGDDLVDDANASMHLAARQMAESVASMGGSAPATQDAGTVRDFYRGGALPLLPATSDQLPSVLEKLGQPPFPKNKFPFLGFLASIYDHIAERAHLRQNGDKPE